MKATLILAALAAPAVAENLRTNTPPRAAHVVESVEVVEAVDICADKNEDHWGTFLFYLVCSASWSLLLCNCKLTLTMISPFSLLYSSSLSSLFVFLFFNLFSLSLSDTVSKNDDDRVDEDTFADYFKTSTAFGMALANNQDYDAYLRQVFQSGQQPRLLYHRRKNHREVSRC